MNIYINSATSYETNYNGPIALQTFHAYLISDWPKLQANGAKAAGLLLQYPMRHGYAEGISNWTGCQMVHNNEVERINLCPDENNPKFRNST